MSFKDIFKKGIFIEEHGDPRKMSRRQLIQQGFIAGGSVVAVPSLLSTLMSQQAFGCTGSGEVLSSNIPVLIFDLAGGGNIVGSNLIPGTRGGQKDIVSGLDQIGINGSADVETSYGLDWHNESMILKGMKDAIPAAASTLVMGSLFAAKTDDDVRSNRSNPSHALLKAGVKGSLVPFMSNRGVVSGSPQTLIPDSSRVSGMTPVVINSSGDALSIVKKNELATSLSPQALDKILKAASKMSESALCEFNKKSLSEQMKEVCGCTHDKAFSIMTEFTEDNIAPDRDTEIQRIFGSQASENIAANAKLLVNGYAGVGVVMKAGFDYHDGSRSTGDAKDLVLGHDIGRVIAYAHAMQKPVAIMIITDGGVLSNGNAEDNYNAQLMQKLEGRERRQDLQSIITGEQIGKKLSWRTDANNVRGGAVMFVYHPSGVSQVRSGLVGAYRDGGVVDDVNAMSNSAENMVAALTANWLALNGRQGEIANIMNEGISGNLDDFIVFDQIKTT